MLQIIKSSIAKKIFMSISGLVMVLFIIIHVIGNSTIYFSGLNAYAGHLHALPLLVWIFRMVMLSAFIVHVILGIQLTLENRSSKPGAYAVNKSLSTTFSGKNMIWTGLLIGLFLVYHILHFTIQIVNPEISSAAVSDAMGRPDVSRMVILGFKHLIDAVIYVAAMTALLLHLTHGIQSSFQSLGLSNERTLPVITKTGSFVAFIVYLVYISVPILIYIGIMNI